MTSQIRYAFVWQMYAIFNKTSVVGTTVPSIRKLRLAQKSINLSYLYV